MTPEYWAMLIPAVAGCLGALAAYLRAEAAHRKIEDVRQNEKAN